METVRRTATNPETGDKYQIKLPASDDIKQTILELPCPPDGMRINDTAKILAEKFGLSDKQKNAVYKSGDNIFYHWVQPEFRKLLDEGKLKQPGGEGTPYFHVDETVDETPQLSPDEPIEEKYQKLIEEYHQELRDELTNELLQQINETLPVFFERLVLDLLVKTGYGGSGANAKAVGGSRDAGIDGIIYGGSPWFDTIYVQVKHWKQNVSRPEIQKFAGALQGQSAQKGIFVTTSNFSKNARKYVDTIAPNPKVILIDGVKLAQLMIDHGFGVYTEKINEIKRVDMENTPDTRDPKHPSE